MTPTKDSSKYDYLTKRPFLVIQMFLKPTHAKVHTERKDWLDESSNYKYDEVPLLVRRISQKHLRNASVIIDLKNKTIVKNKFLSVASNKVLDEIRDHKDKITTLKQKMKTMTDLTDANLELDALKLMIRKMKTMLNESIDVEKINDQTMTHFMTKYSESLRSL